MENIEVSVPTLDWTLTLKTHILQHTYSKNIQGGGGDTQGGGLERMYLMYMQGQGQTNSVLQKSF